MGLAQGLAARIAKLGIGKLELGRSERTADLPKSKKEIEIEMQRYSVMLDKGFF